MAFTDAQKDQIRGILGFALGFYQYNYRIESMMDKVGGNATDQAVVEGLLASITAIDTAINSSVVSGVITGSLKAVTGDVEWYNFQESGGSEVLIPPKQRGRMLVSRLATCLGYTVSQLQADGHEPWFFENSAGRGGEMRLG